MYMHQKKITKIEDSFIVIFVKIPCTTMYNMPNLANISLLLLFSRLFVLPLKAVRELLVFT